MTSMEPVSLEIPRGLMRALGSRWRGQALFDNKSFCLFISPQICQKKYISMLEKKIIMIAHDFEYLD